jgi:DNA recombination protein RmuC
MTAQALLIVGVVVAVAVVLGILIVYRTGRKPLSISPILEQRLLGIEVAIGRSDAIIREEFGRGRDETREGSRSLREEVTGLFDKLTGSLRASLTDLANSQQSRLEGFATRLTEAKAEAATDARNLREEIQLTLRQLGEGVGERIGELAATQGQKLDAVTAQITTLTEGNERRQETLRVNVEAKLSELKSDSGEQQAALRRTVEERLDAIRNENMEKLEQMRRTVDEKLQTTLEQRLGSSFQIVADRLNEVYKSMGEMQTLASGVGDLKRLLTNVKTRGAWGEVTLGNLLEEMMAPDQYERNVEIVPGSNQRVEYAIRLPGDGEVPVWLPLDAKFPMEDYDRLLDASQRGDVDTIEIAARSIETVIRGSARAISEKYIRSPHSTEFAVLFLPTEGLFAEVVRRPGLVDALQREWHIIVAGPTTLLSLLVSLRVGFRSLAIQKHSNEVWKVLAAVKTEFGKFGGILDKVSRKLQETRNVIDVEVGRRRRAMDRKLQGVEVLSEVEAIAVLELDGTDEFAEEPERYAAE